MAFRLIQTKFTGQPSVILFQQGLWNDFRGPERISSASYCDVKQVGGREKKAKELKNKFDYFESYWFRPIKWLRQVEKCLPSHGLNCNSEQNQIRTPAIIFKRTHIATQISYVLTLRTLFGERAHPFLLIFSDYSRHCFTPASSSPCQWNRCQAGRKFG